MTTHPLPDFLQHQAILSHQSLADHGASLSQLHRAALCFLKASNCLLKQLTRHIPRILEVDLEVSEGGFGEQT